MEKKRKSKRQGRSKLPPPLPYGFVNKTWHKGYEICGPKECECICKDKDLVCVESLSGSGEECTKHKCGLLCGEQKKVEELNHLAVMCHQDEKCSEDNQKCERMSVDKEEVLDGLEGLVNSLAQLINETETNLEGLMKRGYSDFSLIHHIN